MNERFIKIFSDLAFFEDFVKRPFPAKAYRNAIQIFKELDFEVDDADQIKDLYGIGDGIYKKVKSYLETGSFPRYEEFKNSDAIKCMEIAQIKGFGTNKAKKLFDAGIKSLEELKTVVASIKVGEPLGNSGFNYTKSMQIGLEYEAHTNKTRMTVKEHDTVANPLIENIKNINGVREVMAVGSRRRYDNSVDYTIGDIDIIISVNSIEDINVVNPELVNMLDAITMNGNTKISGIKNNRQVDFRIVVGEFGSLKLHATGPMSFNVACRKIAIKNGWTLNEYGLFKSDTKELIEKDSEEKILNILGIGWIEPKNRKNFK